MGVTGVKPKNCLQIAAILLEERFRVDSSIRIFQVLKNLEHFRVNLEEYKRFIEADLFYS